MAARIEDAFGLSDECSAHSPAPHGGTPASSADAGTSAWRMSDADYAHERAITAAGQEVEMHMRLRQDALDRYRDTSCLLDQADADRHLQEARDAAELQGALIAARKRATP